MTIMGNQIAVSLDTILFATDFSPSAETAKLYVQALGYRYQSQVRLMHVVDLGRPLRLRTLVSASTSFAGLEKNPSPGCGPNWSRRKYGSRLSYAKGQTRPRRFCKLLTTNLSTCW